MSKKICACCGHSINSVQEPKISALKTNFKFFLCDLCASEENQIITTVECDDLPERVDMYYRLYKNNGISPVQR